MTIEQFIAMGSSVGGPGLFAYIAWRLIQNLMKRGEEQNHIIAAEIRESNQIQRDLIETLHITNNMTDQSMQFLDSCKRLHTETQQCVNKATLLFDELYKKVMDKSS